MKTRRWMLALAPALALVLAGVWAGNGLLRAADEKGDTSSLQGKAAPNVMLQTVDGKKVSLADQKGKVVLLDFWATWCPPCRKSLPHVQELSQDKDMAKQGLVVWAVNSQEKEAQVADFLEKNKFTFAVPMDVDGKAGGEYLIRGIPTTVVVGRDGTVKAVFIGFGPKSSEEIDAAVKSALAEKAPAA